MADKSEIAGDGASLQSLVTLLADTLENRRSNTEAKAEEYEKQRVASVRALNERCAEQEKLIRESVEAKQFPQIAVVALRFGWSFEEFVQNVSQRGQPRTIAA